MKLFNRLAILANTTSLHPCDGARFYALMREGRQEISGYPWSEGKLDSA